jgi:acetoin utilization deacetylase AcuC-like enzyme
MTAQIVLLARECCDGRVVSVLEGGYKCDDLAKCVTEHVKALAGAQIDEHQTRGSARQAPVYADLSQSLEPESQSDSDSSEEPISNRFANKRPRVGGLG